MNFNEYQEKSKRTMPSKNVIRTNRLANYGMGLSGEAAEVTDELKKHLFHGHDLDKEKIKEELGDTLHYVAGVATILGIDLDDAAFGNIQKLQGRYPDGFSAERSVNRND
jgi:NTP pyrophosphatase (non-canonical NTP hydrolase)